CPLPFRLALAKAVGPNGDDGALVFLLELLQRRPIQRQFRVDWCCRSSRLIVYSPSVWWWIKRAGRHGLRISFVKRVRIGLGTARSRVALCRPRVFRLLFLDEHITLAHRGLVPFQLLLSVAANYRPAMVQIGRCVRFGIFGKLNPAA